MILSAQTIRKLCTKTEFSGPLGSHDVIRVQDENGLIKPFVERTVDESSGMSYGLSQCGYDIRVAFNLAKHVRLGKGDFCLAYSIERIKMPNDLVCIVHDKSSWARQGLAVQNTVLEPGWEGHITLELSAHSNEELIIKEGMPIAQLIFHKLDFPTEQPYSGKYQNQPAQAVQAIKEQTRLKSFELSSTGRIVEGHVVNYKEHLVTVKEILQDGEAEIWGDAIGSKIVKWHELTSTETRITK